MLQIVKSDEVLNLSREIINEKISLAQLEMTLDISHTLSKPTIRSVFRDENGSVGFLVVNVLVNRFMSSFGFSTKLSKDQIEILTVDTLESFGYESLHDIIIFFKMARKGDFGTTKRGVDSNLIYGEWFPMYLEKKADIREQLIRKKENERKDKSIPISEVMKTYKKSLIQNVTERRLEYIEKLTKNMDRQVLEDTIDSWSNDKDLKPHVYLLKRQRRIIKS